MSLITMGASGDDGSGAIINFDFTQAALPTGVTFTRASSATALMFDGTGSATVVGNNVARLSSTLGILSEEARTNFLGVTDTPATQTSGSLATGTYTFWVLGSGSCTVTAGTGTATGLGTATAGTTNVFVVTVAGTFTFTITGSLTQFQCEKGEFPTSYIPNAGAAGSSATRAVDAISATWPTASASPPGLTVIIKAKTASGISTAIKQELFNLNDGSANNRFFINRTVTAANINAGSAANGVLDGAPGTMLASSANGLVFSAWVAEQLNSMAAQIIGQTAQIDTTVIVPFGLTTVKIGADQGASSTWNGWVTKIQLFPRRLSAAQASALASAL